MTSNKVTTESTPLLDDILVQEDDLNERAKSQFSCQSQILAAFESYRRGILRNKRLTSIGRHQALSNLNRHYTNCKGVLNYVAEHGELLDHKLPAFGPLIICGLPRTGTTLLYNLLACDSNCRAPLYTDMRLNIVPPISRSNSNEHKKRMTAIQSSFQQNALVASQRSRYFSVHPRFSIEEDAMFLRHAGFMSFIPVVWHDESDSDTWISDEMKKDYVYDYHEMFLRMLNSVDKPSSHWLLKSPQHSFYLYTLLRHYPNAALIMPHRPLDEVIGSFCSLSLHEATAYVDVENQTIRNTVTKQSIQFIDKAIECIMKFRTCNNYALDQSCGKIYDVAYNDLINQPITTVHRIYSKFGLQWSDKFEAAMHTWLRENPQGKQGRHMYNLIDYGIKHEDIEVRYSDYINFFWSSLSSSTDTVSVSSLSENELNKG